MSDRVFAFVVAVLVTAVMLAKLLHVSSEPPPPNVEPAMAIVWITTAMPESSRSRPTQIYAHARVDRPQKAARLKVSRPREHEPTLRGLPHEGPDPVSISDVWAPSLINDGIDAETFEKERRVFERHSDDLAVAPVMRLTFREQTLFGRLSGTVKAGTCADLRAALKAPGNTGSTLDVIVHTLQERGCYSSAE